MQLTYFWVNLEQIHLPLGFIDISNVSEMYRVANKSGLKMAREKSVGGNLVLEKIASTAACPCIVLNKKWTIWFSEKFYD